MQTIALTWPGARRRALAAVVLAASLPLSTFGALAQDGFGGPPPPLEFPPQTDIAADRELRSIELSLIRSEMEKAVDLVICEKLMRDAKAWPTVPPQTNPDGTPRDFRREDCTPAFKAMVEQRRGILRWRSDSARFTKCTDQFCFGHARMAASENATRPNLRQASLSAHLALRVGGSFDRDISIPYELTFTCDAGGGGRNGVMRLSVRPGPPAIGGAGPLESVLDFLLLPVDISGRVAARIAEGLRNLPQMTANFAECSSIGVYRPDVAPVPEGHSLHGFGEAIVSNAPVSGSRLPIRIPALVRELVTVEFLGLARSPLPGHISPDHAAPGSPLAADYTIYLNGAPVVLPPAGLALPPEGGRVDINFCKTIEVTGRKQLQILFANGLGGAIWTEFGRGTEFGAGAPRRMTTFRRILVPPLDIPIPPIPGGPTGGTGGPPTSTHPVPVDLREFELLYIIRFVGIPTIVSDGGTIGPASGGTIGPAGGGRPIVSVNPALDRWSWVRRGGVLIEDPNPLTPQPCQKL